MPSFLVLPTPAIRHGQHATSNYIIPSIRTVLRSGYAPNSILVPQVTGLGKSFAKIPYFKTYDRCSPEVLERQPLHTRGIAPRGKHHIPNLKPFVRIVECYHRVFLMLTPCLDSWRSTFQPPLPPRLVKRVYL